MFKKISIMALCVFFSGTLYADSANKNKDVESVEEGKHRKHNWCPEANFSDEQKAAVRQLFESSKEKFKGWLDERKKAREAFEAVVKDSNSTIEQATEVRKANQDLRNYVRETMIDNQLIILYDIASVEQREPLLECFNKRRRHKWRKSHKRRKYHREDRDRD